MHYPKYNPETKKYEISTKEELMAMSNAWCEEMPRDGYYLLKNDIDMKEVLNFTPIAHKKERAFIGVFDGNFHSIKNITIKHAKKYVAVFRYLGNSDNPKATIKNLKVENCDIEGNQNVAGIAGVNYGIIERCMVTGKIKGSTEKSCHTVGGISGKNKESGTINNCFVDANIEGSYDVGGISGIQEEGGSVDKCMVLGTVLAHDENGMAGGVVGAFNAGRCVTNCVVALKTITGEKYIGKILGQFEDETGETISNNVVWEGTKMIGNENFSAILNIKDVNEKQIKTKDLYNKLGWDFDNIWDFDEIPILKGFSYDKNIELMPNYPIITSVPINRINKEDGLAITAKVLTDVLKKVYVCYWNEDTPNDIQKIEMKSNDNMEYQCILTNLKRVNRLYYYIVLEDGTTWPYYKENPICVNIGEYGLQKMPKQITLTLGEDDSKIGVNWVTDKKINDSILWYKEKDANEWVKKVGTSHDLKGGVLKGHKVLMDNLKQDTTYQYRVGDIENKSDVLEFKTAKNNGFSFIFVADPQAVSEKDYMAFKKCLDYATKDYNPDFIVNAGDITQNGYKSVEWEACFEVLGRYFEKYPTISIAGNHEDKGDKFFTQYSGRFFMPGVKLNTPYDATLGEFKYQNTHIVTLNTEIMKEKEYREKQLNWLKDTFTKSDKKWKILVIHRGMYMVNHNPKTIRKYFGNLLEEIGINLVLNGHDHVYTRAISNGITYITGGTVGNKFYEYINEEGLAIDVWRDKAGCQTYSIVNVNEDCINIEVYSKENPEDWESFKIIDKVTISK